MRAKTKHTMILGIAVALVATACGNPPQTSTKALTPTAPTSAGTTSVATEPSTTLADGTRSNSTEVADGTYRWTITTDDALAYGTPGIKKQENLATFPWIFTITMNDGTMHLTQRAGGGDHDDGGGTYAVSGDQITFTWQNGAPIQTFTYSVDDDGTLHLVPVLPMDTGNQFVSATEPWTKID